MFFSDIRDILRNLSENVGRVCHPTRSDSHSHSDSDTVQESGEMTNVSSCAARYSRTSSSSNRLSTLSFSTVVHTQCPP